MDPTRFDDLARRLARPLPRRRLLAAAAGVVGLAAARRAAPHSARAGGTCTVGEDCGTRCCNTLSLFCADPERSMCCNHGDHVCVNRQGLALCVQENPQSTCRPGVPWREDQCACVFCDHDEFFCGTSAPDGVCCRRGEETCVNPENPQERACVAVCEDGAGARTEGGARTQAACPQCRDGLVPCKDTCVLPCGPDQVLDPTTCACRCATECGSVCCPLGQECAWAGTESAPPQCCPVGRSCAGVCRGEPGYRCCKPGTVDQGGAACRSSHTCCPSRNGTNACCRKGKETCVRGRCVKKTK